MPFLYRKTLINVNQSAMSPWIGITLIVFSAFCMQHSIRNTERVYWQFIELHKLVTFARHLFFCLIFVVNF